MALAGHHLAAINPLGTLRAEHTKITSILFDARYWAHHSAAFRSGYGVARCRQVLARCLMRNGRSTRTAMTAATMLRIAARMKTAVQLLPVAS